MGHSTVSSNMWVQRDSAHSLHLNAWRVGHGRAGEGHWTFLLLQLSLVLTEVRFGYSERFAHLSNEYSDTQVPAFAISRSGCEGSVGRDGSGLENVHHDDTNRQCSNEEDHLLGLLRTRLHKGTWLYFLPPWNFLLTSFFLLTFIEKKIQTHSKVEKIV